MKHRHYYRSWGSTRDIVYMRCKCGEQIERPATKKEIADFKDMLDFKKPGVHRVWFDFEDRFIRHKKDGSCEWKLKGWKFICAVQKWAKKYPRDVRTCRCDDSHFMGSDIVLIEHRVTGGWRKAKYMGTTVVIIPVNGDGPLQVFLYPSHTEPLIKALQEVRREAHPLEKLERQRDRYESQQTRKIDQRFNRSLRRKRKKARDERDDPQKGESESGQAGSGQGR